MANKEKETKKLSKLDKICIVGALVGLGGVVTGTITDDKDVALISRGVAFLFAGIELFKIYVSRQKAYMKHTGYRQYDKNDATNKNDYADNEGNYKK